jgi:hypothetical protein
MKLRLIYAIHMLAPLSFVLWHIERLAPDTLRALLAFGAS